MESIPSNANPPKKHLISYKGWIMILLMAFLATLRPVPDQNIDYLAGRFVGSVLIIAAIWAFVALTLRWLSHRRATHN